MPESNHSLKTLLSPVNEDSFFSDYWEKQSLHLRTEDPARFEQIFSRRDIDQVVAYTRPRFADQSVFQAIPTPPPTYMRGVLASQPPSGGFEPGLADLREAYDRGKSLVIMGMQHRWHAIAELCRGLESQFHCPVHANLYLTPPGSQGFAAHYDPHEVFALQLEGAKSWRLYDRVERLPMMETVRMPEGSTGQPRIVELNPGDLLYIPRGHVHDAFTSDQASLHLTIGVNVYRWSDLLQCAFNYSIESDERLRESIPDGALPRDREALKKRFKELLSSLSDEARIDTLLEKSFDSLCTRFFRELKMLPGNQFTSALTGGLSANSLLERPSHMICRVLENSRGVAIEFPGNRVTGPHGISSALRFVANASRFRVNDLPDDLSPGAKLGLVKRLVHEGLLSVVADQPKSVTETSAGIGHASENHVRTTGLAEGTDHPVVGQTPLRNGHSNQASIATPNKSHTLPLPSSEPPPVSVAPI